MRKQLEYSVHTLIPYINWVYFDHAWGVSGKTGDEKKSLREDAMLLLEKMNTNSRVQCIFRLCEANSEGDDIIVDGVRIPMLRQQQTTPSLCLADFIRPKSMGIADRIGLFATTCHNLAQEPSVEGCAKCDDPYQKMLLQTLSDRLAEAAAEVLHLEVRKHYWGYAPDENLTIEDLHAERFQGIRPALGPPRYEVHRNTTHRERHDGATRLRQRTYDSTPRSTLFRHRKDRSRPTQRLRTT